MVLDVREVVRDGIGVQERGDATAKARQWADDISAELRALDGKSGKDATRRRAELHDDARLLRDDARFVRLNGVNHFFTDTGPRDGAPVVFVHGWDCSSRWWYHLIPELNAAGYRTINYDLRGHGLTDDVSTADPTATSEQVLADGYSLNALSGDLSALLDHLGLRSAHLASFSIGALIATYYAAQNPERIRSIAFFNFGLFKQGKMVEQVMPRVLSTIFSKFLKRVKGWRIPYYYVRMTIAKNPATPRDILYGLDSLKNCSAEASYYTARAIVASTAIKALPDWAAKLTMPTLLVVGSHDYVIGPKNAAALAAALPNVDYFVMPKCGHLVLFELPTQVATLMKLHLGREE